MKYDTVSCYYFHFISDKSSITGNLTFKYFYLHLMKATWPNKILLTDGVQGQFEKKVGALFIHLIKTITSEGDAGVFHTRVTDSLFWGLLYCLSVDFQVKGDEIWNRHNYMTRRIPFDNTPSCPCRQRCLSTQRRNRLTIDDALSRWLHPN